MERKAKTAEPQYSLFVGLIFTFNLIVGTGALAIPKAFSDAGYALGISILAVLAFASYVSTTFVVEAMATGNALVNQKKNASKSPVTHSSSRSEIWDPEEEEVTPSSPFEIKTRLEVGQLAALFLNKVFFFYLCLIVYLFGDLAIYATVVPKSLVQVICTYIPPEEINFTCLSNFTVSQSEPCWSHVFLTRMQVYRLCVMAFGLVMGPFVFFNVTKTKYLQIATSVSRWTAITLMVVLCSLFLAKHPSEGVIHPTIANGKSFAPLFGVCVYAFMCQHSLPGLLTPMRTKGHLHGWLLLVVISVLGVYSTLAMTAVFTFDNIYDVYTLNFRSACQSDLAVTNVVFFEYFLALYPVFTLSTNFPIIGVTLRNNLRKMFVPSTSVLSKRTGRCGVFSRIRNWFRPAGSQPDSPTNERLLPDDGISVDPAVISGEEISEAIVSTRLPGNSQSTIMWAIDRLVIPVLVVILPITVAMVTNDVEFLVSFTGSYAGVGVQYVMPAILVLAARKLTRHQLSGLGDNVYRSPFSHVACVIVLLIWAGATVIIVTLNHIFRSKK